MTEKQASSEIAQSREQLRDKLIAELKWSHDCQLSIDNAFEEIAEQAERDTQERVAQPKMMWGWDIEEIKSAMRQFQSKHPGELPSEVERAERIRGKE